MMNSAIPAITGEQMAAVDQLMMGEFGHSVLQVMELAGWQVANFARERFLGGNPQRKNVLIVAGTGGNGGDGLVAARHLHNWGADVRVVLSRLPHAESIAEHQFRLLQNLNVDITIADDESITELPVADLIIDALLGFSLHSAPTGETANLINDINARHRPVLSIDLPSGLSATEGTVYEPCVVANTTLTLGLTKTGLLAPEARAVVGELYVADIGVPLEIYVRLGVHLERVFVDSPWKKIYPSAT